MTYTAPTRRRFQMRPTCTLHDVHAARSTHLHGHLHDLHAARTYTPRGVFSKTPWQSGDPGNRPSEPPTACSVASVVSRRQALA
jgi:hypothetical protein